MKLVMDIHHDGDTARVGAVAFDDWAAGEATKTYVTEVAHVEKARPGEPWGRDLPGLLQLLHQHKLSPEVIVIDGFVYSDAQETPALGQFLHHALGGAVAVIGISKTAMKDTPAQFEVMREEETRPLVITSAGIDLGAAKARVRTMHGRKRLPTLLKLATRIAKCRAD